MLHTEVNVLDETAARDFVNSLLDKTQHQDFALSLAERKVMLDILKHHPKILQRKGPKFEHHGSKRRPDLDRYDGVNE